MKSAGSHLQVSQWLEIADALTALHELIYGVAGPFDYLRDTPISPTCLEAAECIRNEFTMPRRHADQKGWLKTTATSPLKALNEIIGNDRTLYAHTAAGRLMLDKIRGLRSMINAAEASS